MMTDSSTEPTIYYKGMLENGLTRYERPGWFLPKGSRPGKWMPKIQTVELCSSGYHVCTIDQLREWIAPAIYVVEVRGTSVEDGSKSAWQQARLVRRVEGWGMDQMVVWAKACADHVAHFYAATYAASSAAAARAAAYATRSYAYAAAAAATASAYAAYASAAYAARAAAYATAYAYASAAYAYAYAYASAAYASARTKEIQWQTDLLKTMLRIEG